MPSPRVMERILPPHLMLIVRSTPQLSAIDERAAAERGDVATLVRAHLRMVPRHVLDCLRHNSNLQADDLVAQAAMGLVIGCQRWRSDGGARVATYATWWIRAMLRRYVQQHRHAVSMPLSHAGRVLFSNLRRAQGSLRAETGSAPPDVVAKQLGVAEADVRQMDALLAIRSTPIDEDRGPRARGTSSEAIVSQREQDGVARAAVERLLGALTARERQVMSLLMLGDERATLDSVARHCGCTRQRIQQIRVRALSKMRAAAQGLGVFAIDDAPKLLGDGRSAL